MKTILDPVKTGTYTISEAARYISTPYSTIFRWSVGAGAKGALVKIPSKKPNLISFMNLTELHLLCAIRREYKISTQKISNAIKYLKKYGESEDERNYPLACGKLHVDKDRRGLFVRQLGVLVEASRSGQIAMHDLIGLALDRIELDEKNIPAKFYPFTRYDIKENSPKKIVIDPRISFGRPVISGTGIPTNIVAGRYKDGESIRSLSKDYGCLPQDIEEAIRVELQPDVAA